MSFTVQNIYIYIYMLCIFFGWVNDFTYNHDWPTRTFSPIPAVSDLGL